jgi:hypothetical protein
MARRPSFAILLGLCIVAAGVVALILTRGHSLIEEQFNANPRTVTTTIGGCSQQKGVLSISGATSTNRVGLVQVDLYALSGPSKYVAQRVVTLGMMSPTQGTREWTDGVSYAGKAWGCGVKTTIGPPPPL